MKRLVTTMVVLISGAALAGGIEGVLQTDRGAWTITAEPGAAPEGASGGAARRG